jgi:DNA-binding winged helix-turn-helix (wHTH) protein/TolB-like protein
MGFPGVNYEFDRYCVNTGERVLLRDGEPVPLAPKAFDILLALVEQNRHIVEKDELMKRVWPDTFVEESNLTFNVSVLRKTLVDGLNGNRFIETVPRRGYRFVASVRRVCNGDLSESGKIESGSRTVGPEVRDESASGDAPQQMKRGVRRVWNWKIAIAFATAVSLIVIAMLFLVSSQPKPVDGPRIRTIAVLPFKPLVSDDHNESLEVGISDTLITRLSTAREIAVRPLSAVRKYTDPNQHPASAGRELLVDGVLDGSIQLTSERIRVTVRLTRVSDEVVLWSEKFDDNLADVFTMQDSICAKVTAALALRLNTDEKTQQAKHYTENPRAYQLYLKGRYFWNKRTREGMTKAVEYFQEAINLDPNYALAYSGLADCYSLVRNALIDGQARGIEAASKAVELDDSLAEAHTSLAMAWWSSGDKSPRVEADFRRAIELNPNYATAHHWYSNFMIGRGQIVLEEIRRAQELDPLSGIINSSLGTALYYSHRYDEAVEQLKKTLELGFDSAHGILGMVYLQQRRYQQAIDEFKTKRELEAEPVDDVLLIYVYAVAGRTGEARRELGKLEPRLKKKNELSSADMSIVFLGFGQKDRAIRCLEEGLEARDQETAHFLILDPILDSLRSDPRFADLVRRAHLLSTSS